MPYLYTGGPELMAKGERARRQLAALTQVGAGVTRGVQRYGQYQQQEVGQEAQLAGLAARLGQAQDEAQTGQTMGGTDSTGAESPPQSALSPGMLGPTPPAASSMEAAGGTSDQTGSIREEPAGSASLGDEHTMNARHMAQGDSGMGLGSLARGAAATVFGAYIPNKEREIGLARLKGEYGAREDRIKTLLALRSALRGIPNVGAVINKYMQTGQFPNTGMSLGALASRPPSANQQFASDLMAVSPNDPMARIKMFGQYYHAQPAAMIPGWSQTTTGNVDPTTGQPLGPGDWGKPSEKRVTARHGTGAPPDTGSGSSGLTVEGIQLTR